jgi:hypothetical protein
MTGNKHSCIIQRSEHVWTSVSNNVRLNTVSLNTDCVTSGMRTACGLPIGSSLKKSRILWERKTARNYFLNIVCNCSLYFRRHTINKEDYRISLFRWLYIISIQCSRSVYSELCLSNVDLATFNINTFFNCMCPFLIRILVLHTNDHFRKDIYIGMTRKYICITLPTDRYLGHKRTLRGFKLDNLASNGNISLVLFVILNHDSAFRIFLTHFKRISFLSKIKTCVIVQPKLKLNRI